MTPKNVFLLEKAFHFKQISNERSEPCRYDEFLGLTLAMRGEKQIPLITATSCAPTQYKTMQEGGDDGVDPDDEKCY